MSINFGFNKLQSSMTKGIVASIALILILTMATLMETGMAQLYSYTPTMGSNGLWNVPTFPGITVSPNPVGVGQTVQVIMLIELLPPSVGSEGSTVVYGGWPGYVLTITAPDGTNTTMGPYESDVSGTYQVGYTPSTVGTYYFQFYFPGFTNNNGTRFGTRSYGNYSANFLASMSESVSLTVQQQPLEPFPEAPVPLPNQYWTRPINAQNRGWNVISGPWLQSGYNSTGPFNPYTYAPNSAHILWTQMSLPVTAGLVGGAYSSISFGGTSGVTGTGYPEIGLNSRTTPIVIGGYVYYNSPVQVTQPQVTDLGNTTSPISTNQLNNITNLPSATFSCLDLHTGKILWTVPGSISTGQILNWRTQQQRLAIPYLWSIAAGAYKMYDAVNGQLLAQWFNQPAGAVVFGTGYNATIGTKQTLLSPVSVLSGTVVVEPPSPLGGGLVGQTITGAQGGGAILVYITGRDSAHGVNSSWLACWNSTLAINSYDGDVQVWNFLSSGTYPLAITAGVNGPSRFPTIIDQAQTPLNWENGIMWNYTIPPMYTTDANGNKAVSTPSIVGADLNYVILSRGKSSARATGTENYEMEGFSLAHFSMVTSPDLRFAANLVSTKGMTASAFYNATASPDWVTDIPLPAYDQTYPGSATLRSGGNIIYPDTSVLAVWDFDETTGKLKWSSNPFQNDFALQSVSSGTVAYGMLYMNGYDGYMHALNITTGVQQWVSVTSLSGLEMPEEAYPAAGAIVADGKVYCSTSKAYETIPLYRGHRLYCYDATSGAQLWNISGEFSTGNLIIADGILMAYNTYDSVTYAFGPGPSATTVAAPMTSVTAGTNILIEGTVTDQTPGILQGTPAISDQWMSAWMEYWFMDQPLPGHATGVPVSIDAVDPNGNYIHIGNATSDMSGTYRFAWNTPNVPGTYTIVATFAGSNSYDSSYAETGAFVSQPAAATPAPQYPVPYDYTMTIVAGVIAIIIAVAIVGVLVLRKKP